MQYRFLGRSGVQISCISLSGRLTYGSHVENETTFACMQAAYAAGINFFDCAEGYAGGESEKVMGERIRKFGWKRNDYVVSTKINWGGANGDNPVKKGGLSRKHLVEGTKATLKPIADRLETTQAALAVAWVLKNPHVASAITGASRVEQVYDAVRSISVVEKLTDEVIREIDEVFANKPAALMRRF